MPKPRRVAAEALFEEGAPAEIVGEEEAEDEVANA